MNGPGPSGDEHPCAANGAAALLRACRDDLAALRAATLRLGEMPLVQASGEARSFRDATTHLLDIISALESVLLPRL